MKKRVILSALLISPLFFSTDAVFDRLFPPFFETNTQSTATDAGRIHASASGETRPTPQPGPERQAQFPLPLEIPQPGSTEQPIALWGFSDSFESTEVDGYPAWRIASDRAVLPQLQVGDEIRLALPSAESRTLSGRVESTHNQVNQVEVYKGYITGAGDLNRFILVRGQKQATLVLSLGYKSYSVTMDYSSGITTVVDEAVINRRISLADDAVPAPRPSLQPPASGRENGS